MAAGRQHNWVDSLILWEFCRILLEYFVSDEAATQDFCSGISCCKSFVALIAAISKIKQYNFFRIYRGIILIFFKARVYTAYILRPLSNEIF